MPEFKIGERRVGDRHPVYFIADISANHDGQLERAKRLIRLARAAGADAAKFQHFRAPKIVSRHGFEALGGQLSHQAKWKKSVYEVYQDASLPWDWTRELKACCDEVGIDFFSAPYDLEAVDMLRAHVPVWKIGSGDITWVEMLEKVATQGQPVILATGASDLDDVRRAVAVLLARNPSVALLQCNTNYTGSAGNFDHIHLNVLQTYRALFPEVVLGLSDHTSGHATVLGAVALGARVIEKHFTDDNRREGPDHPFSMTPDAWVEMVKGTRELERALGRSEKRVADNERDTLVVQRRCLRAARDLAVGTKLACDDVDALRPAPPGSIPPYEIDRVIGRRLRAAVRAGEHFTPAMLE
jgi:N-acetylneuraminate synthase